MKTMKSFSSRLGLTKKEVEAYKLFKEYNIALEVSCDELGRIRIKPRERGSVEKIEDAEVQKQLYKNLNNLSQKLERRSIPYYHLTNYELLVNTLQKDLFSMVIEAFKKKKELIKRGLLQEPDNEDTNNETNTINDRVHQEPETKN